MTKKEHVKQLMLFNFGPASASLVDRMTETEAIEKCRAKLLGFYGKQKAEEVDNFDEVNGRPGNPSLAGRVLPGN